MERQAGRAPAGLTGESLDWRRLVGGDVVGVAAHMRRVCGGGCGGDDTVAVVVWSVRSGECGVWRGNGGV